MGLGVLVTVAGISLADGARPDAGVPAECSPMEVSVDGEKRQLPFAYARGFRNVPGAYEILFFEKKMGCETVLAPSFTLDPKNLHFSVQMNPITRNDAVFFGGDSRKGDLSRVATPQKVGDPVAFCLGAPVQIPALVVYKGVTLTVSGRLSGQYCGDI